MSSPVSCPDPAVNAPCRSCGDPSPGQILVMFAIFLIGMLGMLGLCTDLGVAFMQRRTVQAAADAGALAGTRIVAKSSASTPLAARADVEAVVAANMSAVGSIGSIDCSYVNDNGQAITDCAAIVPA